MNLLRQNPLFLSAALLLVACVAANAHPGHHEDVFHGGLGIGFFHPLGGLDHLLAMLAVGLWASQLGGKALWAVPVTFLAAMLLGGVAGVGATGLPMLEQGITASVFILGLLIATAVRPPLFIPLLLVAFFALFHGFAHGAELPPSTGALSYATGFLLATALLHAAGLALGMLAASRLPAFIPRIAGAAVAATGAFLFFQTFA